MKREFYQCTAGDLATDTVDTVPVKWSAGEALDWLNENGYDAAPVVEDGQPIGYVAAEDLIPAPEDGPISSHACSITLERIISSAADFKDVLSALYEDPYYFLGGRNQVTGILTRADLNTSPAYIHLYDRLSFLEELFRDLITEKAPDWKENSHIDFHHKEVQEIERRYQRAQSANIALEEIHYAQFSTLAKVITAVNDCWRQCGFSSETAAERELSDVTDIRNAVAHSNLLIENTDQGLMGGRTVGTVLDAYQTIDACITALN